MKTDINTPKDFFIHLLNTAVLFVSIISFISLIFQYISASFPDPLTYYFSSISQTIRWATAALLIVFPVYIATSWLIQKDIAKNPEKRDIRVRRWLIYFTLFVAAITIIVDLITILYNYLGGELDIQFFLKTLTVLIVALIVFGYYIWDIRQKNISAYKKIPRTLAISTSVIIITSIVSGFFIVGSPAEQRAQRFDEQRVNHLQIIQQQVIDYWIRQAKLPAQLSDLNNDTLGFSIPTDPESEVDYEYIPKDTLSFEICAIFKTKGSGNINIYGTRAIKVPAPYYGPYDQNWEHDIGRHCFHRTIDPKIYKPLEQPVK